ncbi:hypothetical protein MYRNA_214 [Mycobacterium phage Myrna]|uniref:Uncharacterized protein n=1 Tax=Mycobacterium phage Myrna TaxID=546805 RepID=B5LJI4_9CAUD|nr:gp214 [Mycobacterium phage Myrna]ACH62181.1 hypothetical protein MYRNA_214 [Mycobacterium phage Myrna]
MPMPLVNPLTGKPFERPAPPAPEAVEIYPSELPKVQAAFKTLQDRFAQKVVEDPLEAANAFNQLAVNEFGDIGFEIEVEWHEASENPFGEAKMYVPRINIVGRTRKETEIDHDRMQHDIVTGKADGVAGYIREDGSEREDPIKKIIV